MTRTLDVRPDASRRLRRWLEARPRQAELARAAGLSPSTVNSFVIGRAKPSRRFAAVVVEAGLVPPHVFFDHEVTP